MSNQNNNQNNVQNNNSKSSSFKEKKKEDQATNKTTKTSSFFAIAPAGNFANPKCLFKTYRNLNSAHKANKTNQCLFKTYRNLNSAHKANKTNQKDCGIFRAELEQSLRNYFLLNSLSSESGTHDVDFNIALTAGGTEALYLVFTKLFLRIKKNLSPENSAPSKNIILMGAYNCPDIAFAAIKAGFKISLIDFFPDSLELNSQIEPAILEQTAAVVLSNLYGYPDKLEPWLRLKREYGFELIDDACQCTGGYRVVEETSALGGLKQELIPIGFHPETLGVISFGRGKAISGIGGGAIVVPKSKPEDSNPKDSNPQDSNAQNYFDKTTVEKFHFDILGLVKSALFYILEKPFFYSLLNKLPFTGLGDTKVKNSLKEDNLSYFQLLSAITQVQQLEETRAIFLAHTKSWLQNLAPHSLAPQSLPSSNSLILPFNTLQNKLHETKTGRQLPLALEASFPTRFPIIFPSEITSLEPRHFAHLGVSKSYPKTIDVYPEFCDFIVKREIPHASSVAKRIFTLPVHRYVREDTIKKISSYLCRGV